MNSILSKTDKENFYIRLYFNINNGYELAGIRRAFLDFSRTVRRVDENRESLKRNSEQFIASELRILCEKKFKSQEEFDSFHKSSCYELQNTWHELTIGQCQKWINMTLKYWLLFGDERIKGIELNAKYFHIPIDSYVQRGMFEEKNPLPWSKIKNYDEYMRYQYNHRQKKTGNFPIIDELIFFNNYLPK